jgi:hypothetical protein
VHAAEVPGLTTVCLSSPSDGDGESSAVRPPPTTPPSPRPFTFKTAAETSRTPPAEPAAPPPPACPPPHACPPPNRTPRAPLAGAVDGRVATPGAPAASLPQRPPL